MKNLVAVQSAVSLFILMVFGIACKVTGSWEVATIIAIVIAGGVVRSGAAYVFTAHAFAALLATISAFALAYTFADSTSSLASYLSVIIAYGSGCGAYFVIMELEDGINDRHAIGVVLIQIAMFYGAVSYLGHSVATPTTVTNVVALAGCGALLLSNLVIKAGRAKLDS